jgi:hypothetical protein
VISLEEIRKKAGGPWENGAFLKAWLRGESLFPIRIGLGPPSGKKLSNAFAEVQAWIRTLHQHGKAALSYGYAIDERPINHRQIGPQQLPYQLRFETPDDWLRFIEKTSDFADFERLTQETRERLPDLAGFLEEKPLEVLSHRADWSRLLTVCEWFRGHPQPNLYIRQLDIPGVDTKFIESRKGLLKVLLDRIPGIGVNVPEVSGISKHGFERRFGLKYDPPLVRLRLLDERLAVGGLTDLCLPIGDVMGRDFGAATVFITENKINGLSFPPVSGALIIFGLGYGIEILAEIEWLKDKRIYYWGDIDTHGFAMLSQIRGYFSWTRSLLMDTETFLEHRPLWGTENTARRFTGNLSNLTATEAHLFSELKDNRWGDRLRLEQERIAYSRVRQTLAAVLSAPCRLL